MSTTVRLGKVRFTPRGLYNAATEYAPLDVVGYDGRGRRLRVGRHTHLIPHTLRAHVSHLRLNTARRGLFPGSL